MALNGMRQTWLLLDLREKYTPVIYGPYESVTDAVIAYHLMRPGEDYDQDEDVWLLQAILPAPIEGDNGGPNATRTYPA